MSSADPKRECTTTPKLWLLLPADPEDRRWGYDCSHGFVVRAMSEEQARRFAADNKGDEGRDSWLSPTFTKCVELTADGHIGVVMQDFHAG